jgi:hypothetical protein
MFKKKEQSELHQLSSHEPSQLIPDQVQNKAKQSKGTEGPFDRGRLRTSSTDQATYPIGDSEPVLPTAIRVTA